MYLLIGDTILDPLTASHVDHVLLSVLVRVSKLTAESLGVVTDDTNDVQLLTYV